MVVTSRFSRPRVLFRGQVAALNCPEEPDLPCDLNFAVTAIQQNASCGGPHARSLGAD
jgi:hypothetical protein